MCQTETYRRYVANTIERFVLGADARAVATIVV